MGIYADATSPQLPVSERYSLPEILRAVKNDIITTIKPELATLSWDLFNPNTPSPFLDLDPVLGVTYITSGRREEESGLRALHKVLAKERIIEGLPIFSIKEKRAIHFAKFDGCSSLIVSAYPLTKRVYTWGEPITLKSGHYTARPFIKGGNEALYHRFYDRHYSDFMYEAQGLNSPNFYNALSLKELKVIAKSLGLTSLPTKKDYLVNAIVSSSKYLRWSSNPHVWPGWFHDGKVAVMRAEKGLTAMILDRLWEASQSENLAISTIGIFNERHLSLYLKSEVAELLTLV